MPTDVQLVPATLLPIVIPLVQLSRPVLTALCPSLNLEPVVLYALMIVLELCVLISFALLVVSTKKMQENAVDHVIQTLTALMLLVLLSPA